LFIPLVCVVKLYQTWRCKKYK